MKFRLLLVAALCSGAFAADVQVVDQIVAKVNGDIVAQDELERMTREMRQELQGQGLSGGALEDELAKRDRDILRGRIDQLLLVQKGKELNVNVDSEVTKYMTNLQRQAGISDPDKFHEYIRQNAGMSYEDFLAETKNEALTREVISEEVARHIVITDKEISAYYDAHQKDFVREEKVYLSEILISTENKDAAAVAAAEKKAKLLSDEASRGERFSDLARDNSDAATAKSGGVLGGYKKGDLMAVFESAVWNLPKGGVSKPIKIPTGWEILKVDDHTKAGLESLSEAKPEIENLLYGPKMDPKVREYLTELRKAAFLQIKPGYVDSGAAPGMDTKWQDVVELKPETVTRAEVEQTKRHKKFLGVPIPFTASNVSGKSSSR